MKLSSEDRKRVIERKYRNWKGEVSVRHIFPINLEFRFSLYHCKEGEEKWILYGWDLDKKVFRDFAFEDFI